jgi:hypothetical protein
MTFRAAASPVVLDPVPGATLAAGTSRMLHSGRDPSLSSSLLETGVKSKGNPRAEALDFRMSQLPKRTL